MATIQIRLQHITLGGARREDRTHTSAIWWHSCGPTVMPRCCRKSRVTVVEEDVDVAGTAPKPRQFPTTPMLHVPSLPVQAQRGSPASRDRWSRLHARAVQNAPISTLYNSFLADNARTEERPSSSGLLTMPYDVVHNLLPHLQASSLYCLACTHTMFYRYIIRDNPRWRLLLRNALQHGVDKVRAWVLCVASASYAPYRSSTRRLPDRSTRANRPPRCSSVTA
jgi:hypothetical protein